MKTLMRGQKSDLVQLTAARELRVALGVAPGLKFDFCCCALDESGRLQDERFFVFSGRRASPGSEIQIVGEREGQAMTFAVALPRLPPAARRLVFAMTVSGPQTMSQLVGGQWSLLADGIEVARFNFAGGEFGAEKSVIVGEIYFREQEWRVSAVGQGFRGGLDALLQHFGSQNPAGVARPAAPSIPAPSGPRCTRCGQGESRLGQFMGRGGLNRATGRCQKCESEVQDALARLRTDFAAASRSGVMDTNQWGALWTRFENARTGASRGQTLEFLRPDSLHFMERLVTMAASDGVITPAEEAYVQQMATFLELPATQQKPFLERLEHVKTIAAIRQGHLPRIAAGRTQLEAGEICHLNAAASYHKVGARSTSVVPGTLMATSKKLLFLSPNGGWTMQYKNIMSVQSESNSVSLQLATRGGNGRYSVADALWCEAVVTALTRMAKRQLLTPQSDNPSRHIPQDVKNAVWQRDGGKCVQCGASSYLEFDHIIPFSQGGANTVGNVQLLCRKCNLAKGARL